METGIRAASTRPVHSISVRRIAGDRTAAKKSKAYQFRVTTTTSDKKTHKLWQCNVMAKIRKQNSNKLYLYFIILKWGMAIKPTIF